MKSMRLTVSATEISTIFKYYQANKKTVLLWQNQKGIRVKIPAMVFDTSSPIETKFITIGQVITFATDLPIYIYGEYKTLLFKANAKSIHDGELVVTTPRMVRFVEMRGIKRFDISSVKNCLVTLKRKGSNEENEFIYKLNDISENGISFFMGQDSALRSGDEINITHIQNDQISYNLNGRIVHISPLMNSKGVMDVMQTKVGVKLEDKIRLKDLSVYKKFIKDL